MHTNFHLLRILWKNYELRKETNSPPNILFLVHIIICFINGYGFKKNVLIQDMVLRFSKDIVLHQNDVFSMFITARKCCTINKIYFTPSNIVFVIRKVLLFFPKLRGFNFYGTYFILWLDQKMSFSAIIAGSLFVR